MASWTVGFENHLDENMRTNPNKWTCDLNERKCKRMSQQVSWTTTRVVRACGGGETMHAQHTKDPTVCTSRISTQSLGRHEHHWLVT